MVKMADFVKCILTHTHKKTKISSSAPNSAVPFSIKSNPDDRRDHDGSGIFRCLGTAEKKLLRTNMRRNFRQ